ncbi:hypothetical protein R3P38DRAFT_168033 [Favolaschia claudopus]|uniref:F-box domain-containing protein n=1 Tax=Favolaschia claudopus TaxID=2862362 RepID=A0AAW0CZ72_9AGAR
MSGSQTISAPHTIFSLPNELLEAIAAAGQQDRASDYLPSQKSEWVLSHVSQRFRAALLASPALWSIVDVALHSEGSLAIFELYFERSRACPIGIGISLTLQHVRPIEYEENDLIAERLGRITRHLDCIWELKIEVNAWQGEVLLALFGDLVAPNLRRLEVLDLLDRYDLGPVEIFSGGAPKLRYLRIYDVTLQLPVPWAASLTHLELRRDREGLDRHSQNLTGILAQCPSLVDLYLDFSFIASWEHRFHMPSLKRLDLKVNGTPDDFDFLHAIDSFATPSLTEFTINGVHGDQICELLTSNGLPQASFPALKSISFVDSGACRCQTQNEISFPDTATIAASPPLRLFPVLSSLSLINVCFGSNLVRSIVTPHADGWPTLTAVTLSPKQPDAESMDSAILAATNSYRERGLPLPRYRICPSLVCLRNWDEFGLDTDKFDPTDMRKLFYLRRLTA